MRLMAAPTNVLFIKMEYGRSRVGRIRQHTRYSPLKARAMRDELIVGRIAGESHAARA